MKKIKISVIGTSWITEAFLSGVKRVENLVADAVLSRSAEQATAFAEKNELLRSFTLLSDLCQSDTDSVYVASPNLLHYQQCKALLLSGKHVICEKPISVSLSEYCELSDIAAKNSLVFIEAIMYMHTPVRRLLHDAVTKIGTIYSANIDYSQLSSKYPALLRGENPNIFNPALRTGALNDLGVYCVYPAIDLFSCPTSVKSLHNYLTTGADGCGSAILEYPDKLITITFSKVGQSRGVSQIIGDDGTITIESVSQLTGISLFDKDGNRTVISGEMSRAELMGNEAQSFYNFITAPLENALHYTQCREISEKVIRVMEDIRKNN